MMWKRQRNRSSKFTGPKKRISQKPTKRGGSKTPESFLLAEERPCSIMTGGLWPVEKDKSTSEKEIGDGAGI
jgi:hypothetical protein